MGNVARHLSQIVHQQAHAIKHAVEHQREPVKFAARAIQRHPARQIAGHDRFCRCLDGGQTAANDPAERDGHRHAQRQQQAKSGGKQLEDSPIHLVDHRTVSGHHQCAAVGQRAGHGLRDSLRPVGTLERYEFVPSGRCRDGAGERSRAMLPLTVDQGVVGCAAGIVDPGEVADADGAALSVPHRDNPGQGIKSLCIVKVGQCTGLGADPLIEKLTREAIHSVKFPDSDRGWKDGIRALVAAELSEKIKPVETIENPATARVSGPSAAE